ncbi:hypothetical protein BU26DRAFT_520031 [Trematosphaeria pertusa]|uniref:Uncharacterized protein n=1 Tax=Trematosphaeria pertusa TaxID=390896 RepID=A0A6A6ID25_9PLEO|nr:uncharacterized protein BU26DRAFT_520031 [Trematosphaeria pertusa]KAF2248326.1 hypothetical protein BU26DRAFT_520031 [Trematosphaeria pertusa]
MSERLNKPSPPRVTLLHWGEYESFLIFAPLGFYTIIHFRKRRRKKRSLWLHVGKAWTDSPLDVKLKDA